MDLIYYPNKILNEKSIESERNMEIDTLISKMYVTMRQHNGVGLSAIQVGINKRIFILDIDGVKQTVINPSVISQSNDFSYEIEGCLSVPDTWTRIRRPESVIVSFQDENGTNHERKYSGLWSRAFQHEYDHLEGLTFFDRMNELQRNSVLKKYNRKR